MSASASTEEFIELLNAEQHVDLQKLKDYARHGIQPTVRGEVWLYLLGVLSDDKSQEMTSVRSKFLEYDGLDKHNAQLEKRIRSECIRYYHRMLMARHPAGRTLARSSQRLSSRPDSWSSRGMPSTPKGGLAGTSSSHAALPGNHGQSGQALKGGGLGGQLRAGNGAAGTSTPITRGPNRVDNGRWRALATGTGPNSPASPSSNGVMGLASRLDMSMSLSGDGGEEDLTDPETLAANELKHFGAAVQNIISAYLNRARWEAVNGQQRLQQQHHQQQQYQSDLHNQHRIHGKTSRRASLSEHHRRRLSISSAVDLSFERPRRDSAASSSGHSARKSIGSLEAVVTAEDGRPSTSAGLGSHSRASTTSLGSSPPSSPRPSLPKAFSSSPTKSDLTSSQSALSTSLATHMHYSSSNTSSGSNSSSANGTRPATRHRSNTGSSRPIRRLSTSSNPSFSSLPKEYEWAHQSASHHHMIPPPSREMIQMSGTIAAPIVDTKGAALGQEQVGHVTGGAAATLPPVAAIPSQTEYHPDMVYLCAPFVKCIRAETGMYFAFEKLLTTMETHHINHPLPLRVSTFLTLFRTTLPELYAYFDEEEVDVIGLASAWLRHLLAAEMRIEDLLRLWDTYFAMPDFLDLHTYVCLAILTNCKDALEELDQSEAKSMLFNLPPLDVDRILNEAINIRLSHRQSQSSQ